MEPVWIVALIAAALAAYWLARPFLGRSEIELQEADAAMSIYRDQTEEVRRDLESGLIAETEFQAAKEEIEERAYLAARSMMNAVSVCRRSPVAAGAVAGVSLLGALGLYGVLGAPGTPDQPLAERRMERLVERAAEGDMTSRIQLLIEKTRDNPDSFEDWWMLGQSHAAVEDHAAAAEAFRTAAALSGDRPAVSAAYAEALTLANGNKVPPAARLTFEQILQRVPDPRARYYLALAKAQAQDFDGALADWTLLARESRADAPWMPLVRRDIVNMVRFTKRDLLAHLPDATAEEIAKSGGNPDRTGGETNVVFADIRMLQAKLAADPKDFKSWVALARAKSSRGDDAGAAAVLRTGRTHFVAAPFILKKFDQSARALGVDVLIVDGPSAADIAAAQGMSAGDQADMIAGMVAGLAAKLEENPNNPDGWIMLIRSYGVMGDQTAAQKAYDQAVSLFADQPATVARLREETGR